MKRYQLLAALTGAACLLVAAATLTGVIRVIGPAEFATWTPVPGTFGQLRTAPR